MPIIFLGCYFFLLNEKACLGVIAETDFFYRLINDISHETPK